MERWPSIQEWTVIAYILTLGTEKVRQVVIKSDQFLNEWENDSLWSLCDL